ncbi:MAG: hypothetical protein WDN25_24280 [Acetobacteraceae bacterium]
MDIAPDAVRTIAGEELTAWSVADGGTHVRMEFTAADGQSHRIVLPFDVLSGLLMTLPRMLQAALNARFADGSLRFVQSLGTWRLEQAEADANLILRLATRDGFDVAFALNQGNAESLGSALLAASEIDTTRTRRPN